MLYLHAVLLVHIAAKVGVTVLQSVPDGIDTVSPEAVNELVLPLVRTLRYGAVGGVDEHSLDACGAELNAEHRPALLYCLSCIHIVFVDVRIVRFSVCDLS